uniref:cDNA FLJ57700, weakly similar to Protein FAM86A n=1 Tax=Homo sapiens TaxID=9606 RepID=B4DDJ9_HUMAN|nr:unnamed protein product [Homo sapiens]
MAPEENAGSELLLQSFKRRFLAARALRSFRWQSLEAKLRDSSDSELLRDILQKTCCIAQKPSCRWSGSCGGWLPAGSTSGLLNSTWPLPSATQRCASCSPPSYVSPHAHPGLHGPQAVPTGLQWK